MTDRSNTDKPPWGFRRFRAKAEALAQDPEAASQLLETAVNKVKQGGLGRVRAEFLDMLRMVKAYLKGDYKKIPWTSLVMALAGALYFVNPLDFIPDFIVGAGLLDDATVIAFCLRSMRGDLQTFLSWEQTKRSGQSGPEIES